MIQTIAEKGERSDIYLTHVHTATEHREIWKYSVIGALVSVYTLWQSAEMCVHQFSHLHEKYPL